MLVHRFGDESVSLINTVKLHLHPLPNVIPQGGAGISGL
jgi:hypothetical protein